MITVSNMLEIQALDPNQIGSFMNLDNCQATRKSWNATIRARLSPIICPWVLGEVFFPLCQLPDHFLAHVTTAPFPGLH